MFDREGKGNQEKRKRGEDPNNLRITRTIIKINVYLKSM